MKKINKKGYTLIEILAVVIILGILLLIAVPAINKQLNQFRVDYYSKVESSGKAAGKDYISDFSDNQIAEIKDYMGRYNTFEKKIREIQSQINRGSYSTEIIQMFEQIKQRQAKLDQQCQTFLKMTDTVASDFSDVQFNYDYIKSKFSKVSEVVSIVYQFLMETKPLIDEQEREIYQETKLYAKWI